MVDWLIERGTNGEAGDGGWKVIEGVVELAYVIRKVKFSE